MGGPKFQSRQLEGQYAGWIGHVRKTIGTIVPADAISPTAADPQDGVVRMVNDDASQFDPPLRLVRCTVGGTITFVLDADDETNATLKTTITCVAGDKIEDMAIRKVYATGTTGTFTGYR